MNLLDKIRGNQYPAPQGMEGASDPVTEPTVDPAAEPSIPKKTIAGFIRDELDRTQQEDAFLQMSLPGMLVGDQKQIESAQRQLDGTSSRVELLGRLATLMDEGRIAS